MNRDNGGRFINSNTIVSPFRASHSRFMRRAIDKKRLPVKLRCQEDIDKGKARRKLDEALRDKEERVMLKELDDWV